MSNQGFVQRLQQGSVDAENALLELRRSTHPRTELVDDVFDAAYGDAIQRVILRDLHFLRRVRPWRDQLTDDRMERVYARIRRDFWKKIAQKERDLWPALKKKIRLERDKSKRRGSPPKSIATKDAILRNWWRTQLGTSPLRQVVLAHASEYLRLNFWLV